MAGEPQGQPKTATQEGQEGWRKMNTVFTNAKAGMAGVDKEHVQKVVYEMSKVNDAALQPSWWHEMQDQINSQDLQTFKSGFHAEFATFQE